jgi:hypothetical protein
MAGDDMVAGDEQNTLVMAGTAEWPLRALPLVEHYPLCGPSPVHSERIGGRCAVIPLRGMTWLPGMNKIPLSWPERPSPLHSERIGGRCAVIPRWDRSGFARYGHMSTVWSAGDDMVAGG